MAARFRVAVHSQALPGLEVVVAARGAERPPGRMGWVREGWQAERQAAMRVAGPADAEQVARWPRRQQPAVP